MIYLAWLHVVAAIIAAISIFLLVEANKVFHSSGIGERIEMRWPVGVLVLSVVTAAAMFLSV